MRLPPTVTRALVEYKVTASRISRLGGRNVQLSNANGTMLYLKTGGGVAKESLQREYQALMWLSQKSIQAPKIVEYVDSFHNQAYLLMSNVAGLAAQRVKNVNREDLLKLIVESLKAFHAIPLENNCSALQTLEKDLQHIQRCIQLQLIKRKNFYKANGRTPEQVYDYLRSNQHKFSTQTLVHGDFCLPNIIISDSKYGFIDVGDCGPGDPYKDLSALEVSITRNFGSEWIPVFYNLYQPNMIRDEEKIKYFQLIDQFGYHLNLEKYRRVVEGLHRALPVR